MKINNLTEKEKSLFNQVIKGMDTLGCGWLHELAARAGMEDDHSTAGVLGSLVKKGLVSSSEEMGCFWVRLTLDAGKAVGLRYHDDWGIWVRGNRGGALASGQDVPQV